MKKKELIFISYTHKDSSITDPVVAAIKYYGAQVWYQAEKTKQDFVRRINSAIKESAAFICFISHNSLSSVRVCNEINRALLERNNRPEYQILPIVIGQLTQEDNEILTLLMGSFNQIQLSALPDAHALALKIFEQVDFRPSFEQEKASLYSGEKEIEVFRIFQQNAVFNKYAERYLDQIFLRYNSPAVLDVGCSDGKNINIRLKGRAYTSLLGIDIDTEKIRLAQKDIQNSKQTFLCCDISSDHFHQEIVSYLESNHLRGFDLIHVSSVLLHLKNPVEALAELRSLLSPKGTIFIQDEDDGPNLAFPQAPFFDDAFYLWDHSLESGDRKFARKLPFMLKKAGFHNINLLSTTISSLDFKKELLEAFWDLYFNCDLWSANSAEYFNNFESLMKLQNYRKQHEKYKRAFLRGKFFIQLGIYYLTATK